VRQMAMITNHEIAADMGPCVTKGTSASDVPVLGYKQRLSLGHNPQSSLVGMSGHSEPEV